jgi:L-alanine-DL-glutamate epimerase-like enolase superfamily enzyme
VTGWLKASAIAGAAGIPMSTHLYPEVAAHVMRVTETGHWLEWQDWADAILQKQYEMNDGSLHIPDVPGVGLDWKWSRPTKPICRFMARQDHDVNRGAIAWGAGGGRGALQFAPRR